MKQTFITFVCCMVCVSMSAQTVTITPSTSMTIKTIQTLPNLQNAGSVVVSDSATLIVKGSTTGYGILSVTSTSSLVSLPQSFGTVYFDPAKNTLHTLYVQGTLTLGNALNITAGAQPGMVQIRNGTLFADSFLTLKSDLWGTARIDSSSGNILGLVNVERYIPSNRAWRFLTTPFFLSPQSINSAWQEGYINTTLACPAQYPGTPGYGTQLTHNAINGYDRNTTSNPSIVTFAHNMWTAPPSTLTNKITDYNAYAVFVRGDRTICLSQATGAIPVPTTLRASGIVSVGAVTRSTVASIGEYILDGNPYASSIDLLPVTMRSRGIVPETFWVWDPGYGDNGGYVAYSYGLITPITAHYQTPLDVRTVQSGQGFMVQATDSTQDLVYEESDKVAMQSSFVFGRPIRSSVIHIQLSTQGRLVDGCAIRLVDHYQHSVSKTVAKLWKFTGEGISLVRNDLPYSIETRVLKNTDTFFVEFRNIKSKQYVFECAQSIVTPIRLIDRLLHRDIPIGDTTQYVFDVVSTDSSSYINRFMLVYDTPDTVITQVKLYVYPNPVRHTLHIVGVTGPMDVCITDIAGRVLYLGTSPEINCATLSRGLYICIVNGKVFRFEKL